MEKVLEVRNLHKHFGGIAAVKGCDFTVERGTICALIGPNGAGKSTIFNLITGYLRPDQGMILLEGEDITGKNPSIVAQKGLARTFQITRLFPKMPVLENLLVAMKHQQEDVFSSIFSRNRLKKLEEHNMKKASEFLKFVHLDVKASELAGSLSYGQQKLLEIAKTLAQEPEIILFDEPAAGVNPTMLQKIGDLLLDLKKQGKTILFIEHNMEFVMNVADKVVVIDYGDEIAVGTPREIQKNKRVIDAYLGATNS